MTVMIQLDFKSIRSEMVSGSECLASVSACFWMDMEKERVARICFI